MQTLKSLFEASLRDIYFAEKALLATLPEMARRARSRDLKRAFEDHLDETAAHVRRLERVFRMLDLNPEGKGSAAFKGLLQEFEDRVWEGDSPALDAGLIYCARAIEHYEMARYATLQAWADHMDLEDSAELLEETYDDESSADETLSDLAESILGEDDEEEDDDSPKRASEKR